MRRLIYRFIFSALKPVLNVKNRLKPTQIIYPPGRTPQNCIWFHAASAGELESLVTVILNWADSAGEIVITAFSESAMAPLNKLKEALSNKPAKILYLGYSPWESDWLKVLKQLRPSVFVTVKYEAWPELWMSLAELKIPLVIIGARVRRSLLLAPRLCKALGGEIPRVALLANNEPDATALRQRFPTFEVSVSGEPRWDQVANRAQAGNKRAEELIGAANRLALPRPWGVLGSAWHEDLIQWRGIWPDIKGTVWLVPHKVDEQHVKQLEEDMRSEGFTTLRTSESDFSLLAKAPRSCIIVNEMGFLSELYTHADWAYVGGGFGAGVHSTIEPALHGIPIAAGMNGAEKFAEISELVETGQLTLVRNTRSLESWIHYTLEPYLQNQAGHKEFWLKKVNTRLGATAQIVNIIEAISLKPRRGI